MHRGSCLCGLIKFEVEGELPSPTACHCSQCRKHSGHFEASADIPKLRLKVTGEKNLKWFTSTKARRGFCSTCGSSLFWDPMGHDWIGVSMGVFDGPTKTTLAKHIFVADKGDYYEIANGLPQQQ